LYRITKAVRFQPCHFWVSKKRLSYFLAAFPQNACWFLFLLFAYLLVAEAASFDKKELCRSDTIEDQAFLRFCSIYLSLVFYDNCGQLEANLVLPLSKLQVPRSSLARPHTSPSMEGGIYLKLF
jgi:hypothetical protein